MSRSELRSPTVLTDYREMTPERAVAVVDKAIAQGEALIAEILAVDDTRSYANTLAPVDRALILVNDAFGVGGFMARVHTDDAVRAAGAQAEEKVEKWLADLPFGRDLYQAVEGYANSDDARALDGEQRRNLEFWLRDFRRAGQQLGSEDRTALRGLRSRLANAHITLMPRHPDTHFGASFGHMMSDGYVAGYYGYLWSNVYGDDMFSVFKGAGVLNPEIGMRYRSTILARGGTLDGQELLRGFLGREPSTEAFLRKIGLGPEGT